MFFIENTQLKKYIGINMASEYNLEGTLVGRAKEDGSEALKDIGKGIVTRVGIVDDTELNNAKSKYAKYSDLDTRSEWDSTVVPSYYKRIQYWESFIKNEQAKNKIRIETIQLANKILVTSTKDNKAKLGATLSAIENSVKKALPANINKKGICDKLFEDMTNLVVKETRSGLNAVAAAAAAAENSVISMVGTYVDGKLQPITGGIRDFYNSARNFVMDAIEAGLEGILNGTRSVLGLDYATFNTKLSADAQKAIDKVDLLEGYPIMENPTPTKTPGKGVNASSYIVEPLESRKLTPENIDEIKNSLQEEAKATIKRLYDVIGTSMFQADANPDTRDYIVMSLMEAAKERIHVFKYVTDLLGYNDSTQKLMSFANENLRPSNLIKSLLYDNPWGEQNTTAQEAIGSVRALMGFTNSNEEKEFNKKAMEEAKQAYIDFCKDMGKLSPSIKKEVSEYVKLIKAITGMFSIDDSASESNTYSPEPLWGDMRDAAKDGRNDVYGLGSLVKSFRVNKYIPSGEIDYFQSGFSHIFFIKPDLNLTQNAVASMDMTGNPMLGDIITNLNYNNNDLRPFWNDFPEPSADYSRSNSYVSYLLSNMLENIPVTDLTLDTKDAYENLKGFRMPYGLTHFKNTWGGEISLAFKDTKTLLINNILQAWVKYISVMKEGIAECTPKYKNYGYLDYAGAIYGFITEPDGQTITHWFRYTGVFPTNVPFSTISTNRGSQDIPEFNVNFKYVIYESNDVNILRDFNYVMNNTGNNTGSSISRNMEAFAYLGAIPRLKAYVPLSDITLKTGMFPNENHAFVGMLLKEDVGADDSEVKASSPTTMRSNQYRFLLRYDSTKYFQGALIGDLPSNSDVRNASVSMSLEQQKAAATKQWNFDSSVGTSGPMVFR